MEKSCRKCTPKASPRPHFNFQNSHCMQEILLKDILKKDYQKSLKKLYFFFQTQSLLKEKIITDRKGLELVTNCSLGYKTSSEKFLY